MQLWTWIPPAEKDLLLPQIDPMHQFPLGERMTFRHRDENALAPQRHRFRFRQRRGPGDNRNVDHAVA